MTSIKRREIFKAGTWNASTGKIVVTSAMLDDAVSAYNELNSKVTGFAIPIKLGHNRKVGEPAYGYAENIVREGDTLIADFNDMPPEIVDAIGAKRYNAVSVEIWPKVEYDGKTFPNVLSGVALLGAEWPAVKGLQPLYASQFAAEGALLLSQEEPEAMNFTQEQHDAILAAAVKQAKDEAVAAFAAEKATLETAVEAAEQRAETAEAAVAAFAEEAEKKSIADIITAAEKTGAIVPANKPKIVAFAETIRKSVAKGAERTALIASFKDFVSTLPAKVKFTEDTNADDERPGAEDVQAEINKKVAEVRRDKADLSYPDALKIVFEANPELKTRYAEER